jgi:hypothetical protein
VIGESKLLSSAYIWVLLVPIVLRIRDQLPLVITVPVLGEVHPHSFSLPFRIYLFYFSAVFAAIASALYAVCCPRIVKLFTSASDFTSQGRGEIQLMDFFRNLIVANQSNLSALDLLQNLKQFRTDYCTETTIPAPAEVTLSSALDFVDKAKLRAGVLNESFWHLRDMADRTASFARKACWISLLISITLIIVVFVQNLLFVIQRI